MGHFYRSSLLLSFLLLCYGFSFSQAVFGVKAGVNFAKGDFKPYETESLNYILRYHAGVVAEIKVNRRLFFKPELLYSNKGWNNSRTYFDKGIDMNLHYMNLPVLTGFRVNKYISVLAGPEFGYLLKAEKNPGGIEKELFEKFDFGISIGTIFNIASRFGIELRYTGGFKGLIRDKHLTNEYGISNFRIDRAGSNKVLQISTRYRFKNL